MQPASLSDLRRALVVSLCVLQDDVDRALIFAEQPPSPAYDSTKVFGLHKSTTDALWALARWQNAVPRPTLPHFAYTAGPDYPPSYPMSYQ